MGTQWDSGKGPGCGWLNKDSSRDSTGSHLITPADEQMQNFWMKLDKKINWPCSFQSAKGGHPPNFHISPDSQISRQSWVTASVSLWASWERPVYTNYTLEFLTTHTLLCFPNCLCDLIALAKLPLHSTYGQMGGGKWKEETIYMFLLDLQGVFFPLNVLQRSLKSHLFHKELHCLMKTSCLFFHTQSCSNSFPMILYLLNTCT